MKIRLPIPSPFSKARDLFAFLLPSDSKLNGSDEVGKAMPASCTQSRICMQGSSCSVVSGTKHLQSEVSMPGNLIHLVAKCLLASSEGGGNCTGRNFKKTLILALLLPSQQMRAFRAVLDPQDDLFLCTAGNPLTSCTSKGLGMTTAAKREESYRKVRQGAHCNSLKGH